MHDNKVAGPGGQCGRAEPGVQDGACEVSEELEDGGGVLQLQELLLFVLEQGKGEAEYDLQKI